MARTVRALPPYKAIAFCTPGPYEQEAARLRGSAMDCGVDLHVQLISACTWTEAVMSKPAFILQMMDLFKDRPILYVDADAVFRSIPPAQEAAIDFACHWFRRSPGHPIEMLTGTLWFKNTPLVREFVALWAETTRGYAWSSTPEQESLAEAFRKYKDRLIYRDFGPEMVFIFDDFKQIYPKAIPIIEHFQASRRLRSKKS